MRYEYYNIDGDICRTGETDNIVEWCDDSGRWDIRGGWDNLPITINSLTNYCNIKKLTEEEAFMELI